MARRTAPEGLSRSEAGFSELDWAILDELTHDPHATAAQLSERLKLPAAEISARLRRLDRQQASHVIAVLDMTAARNFFCFMQICVRGRLVEDLAAEIALIPEVLMVSGLSGGSSDLLVLVRFPEVPVLRDIVYGTIAGLAGVSDFSIALVLDEPVFHSQYFAHGDYVPLEVEENMRDLARIFSASEMDELDRCVIAELQQNARKSINSIARKYAINASTIRYRIRSLENRGLMRFVTVLNPKAAGLNTFTFFQVQVGANHIPQIVQELGHKKWLPQLFLCAGSASILGIALTDTAETMQRIKSEELSVLPGVERVQISTLLKTYKLDMRWGQRFT